MLFKKGFYAAVSLALSLLSATAEAQLQISDSHIRAVIPGSENTAAYLSIYNDSDKEVTLVSAKSDVASKVEFHDHIMVEGGMRMVQRPELKIGAKQKLIFKSGGLHIMFIGLQKSFEKEVELELTLSNGETLDVTLPVRSIHHEHHHH